MKEESDMFEPKIENPYYLIQEINQEINESEQYPDQCSEFTLLEYRTNGNGEIILFFGEQIWSSEDDEREYVNEDEDEHEPIENFLRRKINEVVNLVSTIKL